MALRAPLQPKTMISGRVFFAPSLVCPPVSLQNRRQPRILQIMPPRPGWLAVYVHSEADDKEYGGEAWHTLPLECLALIEQEEGGRTSTRVVGLVMQDYATGSFSIVSPDDDAFLSYE